MCFFKKGIIQCLLGLACLAPVKAQVEPNPMNVLFIGNSYTLMYSMPDLFEKIAVSKKIKINVEMSAKSGHSFRMHCERPEMFEKINSKKWDYVVIQGFSREMMYDYEHIDTASIPYFNKIVDSIYTNNPCTNILLYMTWGYKNGSPLLPETDSFLKMAERVNKGYQYLSNIYDIPIVPVGDVYKYVREKYPLLNLYQQDEQHPTLSASYLIACSFYSAIFKSSPLDSYSSTVNSKDALLIQRAAYHVVSNNLDNYKLRKNTLDVSYERTNEGGFFGYCKSYYPQAESVKWEFGDGSSSSEKNVVHKYKKPGTYVVKLTINDNCGIRQIYRKVYFKDPQAPQKKKTSKPSTNSGNERKI